MYDTIEKRSNRLKEFREKVLSESGTTNPRCRCRHFLDIHDRYTSGGDETKKIGPMCYANVCPKKCTGFRLDPNQEA